MIITWWRRQTETFAAILALFVRGIHRPPVNSPHKGQWRGALMFSLICAWINGWANSREAGDLKRHRTHYIVTVMKKLYVHSHDVFTLMLKEQGKTMTSIEAVLGIHDKTLANSINTLTIILRKSERMWKSFEVIAPIRPHELWDVNDVHETSRP